MKLGLIGWPWVVNNNPGDIIIIAEGWRDCVAAIEQGECATASTGGVTFKQEWAKGFKGKTVYLIYDGDKAGRDAAQRTAEILYDVAKAVYICYLPDGQDLYDYIASGEDLTELLKKARLYAPPESKKRQYPLYEAGHSGTIWNSQSGPVCLSNFKAEITASVIRDDGAEKQRHFEITVTKSERSIKVVVPAAKFASMHWAADQLSPGHVIAAGGGKKDHFRAAIQSLSEDCPERLVFTHTGWRKVGDSFVYLMGNGAIGSDGWVDGIEVKLPDGLTG